MIFDFADYPLITSDYAGQTVYHVTCALERLRKRIKKQGQRRKIIIATHRFDLRKEQCPPLSVQHLSVLRFFQGPDLLTNKPATLLASENVAGLCLLPVGSFTQE